MKILVLGASGKTGLLLCQLLLERGHSVHALVRNPDTFLLEHKGLTVFTGTPQNITDISKALKGCDAAVSTLSVSMTSEFPWAKVTSPRDLMSTSVKNLLQSMTTQGVMRVVIMTSHGASETFSSLPWLFSTLITKSNLKVVFDDHTRQEKLVMESDREWTLLRPVALKDNRDQGKVVASFNGQPKPGASISRARVADYIVDILEQSKHIKEKPTLSLQ